MTEPIETSSRVHHPFSPSKLQAFEACPCYASSQGENEKALAGTRAHTVTETGEDNDLLGDEQVAAAAECVEFYRSRLALFIDAREKEIARPMPEIIELKETYLPIDELIFNDRVPDHPELSQRVVATSAGYIDRAIISHDGTYAELFDWKFGLWPVEKADNNLQGIAYSLGLFRKYPSLRGITFWFKQPHLGTVDSVSFTRDKIPELYLRIQVVVARARVAQLKGDFSDASPYVPVCNFCANIGKCPKVLAHAVKIAQKFSPLDFPESITPSQIMDPKQTKLALNLAAVMAIWSAVFRGAVTNRVIRGEAPVPEGYKIHSRADREVALPEAFRHCALQYLTAEEYTALCPPPGFTVIEKKISEKAPRGQKEATVEAFAEQLEAVGAVVRGDPVVFLKAIPVKENKETKTQTDTEK